MGAGGSGAGYPTYPVQPARPSRGTALAPVALLVVGVLIAGAAIVWSRLEGGGTATATGPQEVFLEPAASTGANPYMPPADPDPPPTSTTAKVAPTASGSPVASAVTVAPVSQPTSGVMPAAGSPPYGGTGNDQLCDRSTVITFLTDPAHAAQAAAFAGVLGIKTADIATYVGGLRPSQLLYDTRVTNHGFVNGKANAIHSVLQAGTAVLIDASGAPRVRCRCGNPLIPAVPLANPTTTPQGTPWPAYSPTAVVTIVDGKTAPMPVVPASSAPSPPSSTPSSPPSTGAGPGATSTTTTTTGSGSGDTGQVDGMKAVFAECPEIDSLVIIDVRSEPDLPDNFTVKTNVNGAEMIFVYNTTSGDITEGDKASSEVLVACGLGAGG